MKLAFLLIFFVQLISNSNPISVIYEGETIAEVNRAELTSIIGEEKIDVDKVRQFAEKIDRLVYKAPKNASLDDFGGIVPEELGYKLHKEKFTMEIYKTFFDNSPAIIEVPVLPVYPKVDSELLATIRVKRIGQYTTYFNRRKRARVQNISLAVEAINNHVVFPGEVFSFNEVVGKRTLEKGYLPAPIFIKGKIYRDFGGGICQVSSTLFNAADKAGLEILERHSHSRRVPYVPPGRDANVSWYGSDFTFKNRYNQPILIRAKVYGGAVMIMIDSSEVVNDLSRENSTMSLF